MARDDDVAGSEVGQRVLGGHEGHAGLVAQRRALAPQRLRQQRPGHRRVVQRRRVELHELDVGHGRAGRQRHGDAVAGGQRRVGGDREQLPGAAAGQHHVRGPRGGTVRRCRRGPRRPGSARPSRRARVASQCSRTSTPAWTTAATRARSISKPVASPPAWTTRAVEWPPSRARARGRPPARLGRTTAPTVISSRSRVGTLGAQDPDGLGVAQAAAGGEGVGEVQVRGVGVGEGGGDATLRVAGGRRGQLALGHQRHAVARPRRRRGATVRPATPEPRTSSRSSQPGSSRSCSTGFTWPAGSRPPSGPVRGVGRAGCGRRRGRSSARSPRARPSSYSA